MGFLSNFKKNRAIKIYIKKLPRLLVKDYGKSKKYTPKQVKKTAERYGLGTDYICYGMAMFSEAFSFQTYHKAIGEKCDYTAMRNEISEKYFGGEINFGISFSSSFDSDNNDNSDFTNSGSDLGGGD